MTQPRSISSIRRRSSTSCLRASSRLKPATSAPRVCVKPETIQHLETAARNRDLARALIGYGPGMELHSPPFEWVAVVAFYAAVHYVNAIPGVIL